jgi:hypothetical protein
MCLSRGRPSAASSPENAAVRVGLALPRGAQGGRRNLAVDLLPNDSD